MTQLWRFDKAQAPAFTGDGALHLADRWDERHLGLRDWLRSHEIRWLVGLGIVTLCSWARWFATGSTKIDQNYPSEAVGTLLLVALCDRAGDWPSSAGRGCWPGPPSAPADWRTWACLPWSRCSPC